MMFYTSLVGQQQDEEEREHVSALLPPLYPVTPAMPAPGPHMGKQSLRYMVELPIMGHESGPGLLSFAARCKNSSCQVFFTNSLHLINNWIIL